MLGEQFGEPRLRQLEEPLVVPEGVIRVESDGCQACLHVEPVSMVFPNPVFALYKAHRRAHTSTGTLSKMRLMPSYMSKKSEDDNDTSILIETRPKTKRPPLYKVLLLNDDYTPMEFVVHVLERFFGLSHSQAFEIMLTVHKKGVAVVGVFSHEIAETKVGQVMDFARRHQHPLQCTMEKED
jgi:ATP-dependent Clp protease adaptor protein ClpS